MYYIGVDLGGTNIAIGIVNEEGKILRKGSVPTKADREADEIIKDMAALAKKLCDDQGISVDEVEYAGIATPGTARWSMPTTFRSFIIPSQRSCANSSA